jgi:hypothetical protein
MNCKEKRVILAQRLDVSVSGHLALLLWVCDKAAHHGRNV